MFNTTFLFRWFWTLEGGANGGGGWRSVTHRYAAGNLSEGVRRLLWERLAPDQLPHRGCGRQQVHQGQERLETKSSNIICLYLMLILVPLLLYFLFHVTNYLIFITQSIFIALSFTTKSFTVQLEAVILCVHFRNVCMYVSIYLWIHTVYI